MGLTSLGQSIRSYIQQARQQRGSTTGGTVVRGRVVGASTVQIGGKIYPYTLAVDCNTAVGAYVWCELSGGLAVVVGA